MFSSKLKNTDNKTKQKQWFQAVLSGVGGRKANEKWQGCNNMEQAY